MVIDRQTRPLVEVWPNLTPEERLVRAIFGNYVEGIYITPTNRGPLREAIESILTELTPRESQVLRLRFGFDDPDGMGQTLEQVGKFFNVTKERIRQIEGKALRKLRHPSRSRRLKPYLSCEA